MTTTIPAQMNPVGPEARQVGRDGRRVERRSAAGASGSMPLREHQPSDPDQDQRRRAR